MVAQPEHPGRKEVRMNRTTGLATVIVLAGVVLGWIPWPPARLALAQPCADHPLMGVEKKSLTIENFRKLAEAWAREFDAHSLVALHKASVRFDAERDFAKVRAKVLYVLSRTDRLFPPSIAPAVIEKLRAAGVEATYAEIDGDFGHLA